MNHKLANKWVAALRSGEYNQTKGRLRDSEGFCCWGVLCDIVDPNKWKPASGGIYTYGVVETMPPQTVMDQLGIDTDEIIIIRQIGGNDSAEDYGLEDDLAVANDSGVSFAVIADTIEAYMRETANV